MTFWSHCGSLVALRQFGHIAAVWSHCGILVALRHVGRIVAFWSQCGSNETNQESFCLKTPCVGHSYVQ